VGQQIDAIFDDIAVGATKIGMVSRVATIEVIAERLGQHAVRPVLDPVMVATSGDRLLEADAVGTLREQLLPLAALVTPNLPEAALLADTGIAESEQDMIAQAETILKSGAGAVLVKGGHGDGAQSVDILVTTRGTTRYAAPRVKTRNTHGTGCTLSAAIAAGLACGLKLEDAVEQAKAYLQKALQESDRLRVGRGHGPVHHFHHWWEAR
jgi:hydroxymethylpyrimidine/phosphomethylpyrimidine kinase